MKRLSSRHLPLLRVCTLHVVSLLLEACLVKAFDGKWTLLVENAGISSMHTAVTHFNTVILLDRTNIGASQINFTNGYCRENPEERSLERDCSAHSVMLDPTSSSLRPLTVFTDTWCSSGQFFPNGTLVQTGGDYEGLNKIRVLEPCESGGGCDWVELEDELLDHGRWYASNQLLPDKRQIVVGGRNTFSYEFVPKRERGEGAFALSFLREVHDSQNDNMYPFVYLLPDGNLFIFANRDSILLDYVNDVVVRKYPRIPGEPRNYPSSGSSVMLPLDYGNGFTVVEMLVCGGARYGAFLNSSGLTWPASDNCGRMVVTASEPRWRMETMPMRRVMGDMIVLPTGDVLLINGARRGSQGWGKATHPVLNPVKYSTYNATSRFQVLTPSTIARMYHSTANLLSDGRILLAGGNTHEFYTFTREFPTELRVETFDPPYLNPDYDKLRPMIYRLSTTTITYSSRFQVVFTVTNRAGGFELSLMSSPFTTHSFAQGQRMVKLETTEPEAISARGAFSAIATAPRSPNVVPASYYMLWAVQAGVPGKGVWVQVTSTGRSTGITNRN